MLVHDLVEERLLLDVIIKDDLHLRLMRLHLLLSPLYRWHSIHSILGEADMTQSTALHIWMAQATQPQRPASANRKHALGRQWRSAES